VLHCFSGDADFALKCIGMGLYISFTGVITFKNAKLTKEAAKIIPLEKIFIETDAPYLAPQPKRGQENYPSYVKYVAEEIAQIKEISVEEVASVTSKNAEEFFNLK
jgi:TatD DNase family protein